jgi:2-polyprenyl-3-methyl-5-hydroxy-6-metoxy-1,4-benzoquinol methylase
MNKENNKEQNHHNGSKLAIPIFFIKLIFIRFWYFIKNKSFSDVNSSATFWDIIASGMDKPEVNSDKSSHIDLAIEKVKTYLKVDNVVLDYGCATGSDAFMVSGLVKHVDDIDISPKMISIANRRAAENKIENARFFTLTQHKKEGLINYDVIFSLYVLHLIDDVKPVIGHIYNLLAPGGIFISSTVCLGEKKSFLLYILRFFYKIGLIPELSLFISKELMKLIENERFKIIEHVDLKTEKN